MRVGKKDAEIIIENSEDVSLKERELMQVWKSLTGDPKITTLRVYPETIDEVREYARENFKVVPEYLVMDQIIKKGLTAIKEG